MQNAEGSKEFFPKTFVLPHDRQALITHMAADNLMGWVVKPGHGSGGLGLSVVRNVSSIPETGSYVVQQLVPHPQLIGGAKFSIRLFAVRVRIVYIDGGVFMIWDAMLIGIGISFAATRLSTHKRIRITLHETVHFWPRSL